jgi:hypothetical protein
MVHQSSRRKLEVENLDLKLKVCENNVVKSSATLEVISFSLNTILCFFFENIYAIKDSYGNNET